MIKKNGGRWGDENINPGMLRAGPANLNADADADQGAGGVARGRCDVYEPASRLAVHQKSRKCLVHSLKQENC